jgi:hypothetical protein
MADRKGSPERRHTPKSPEVHDEWRPGPPPVYHASYPMGQNQDQAYAPPQYAYQPQYPVQQQQFEYPPYGHPVQHVGVVHDTGHGKSEVLISALVFCLGFLFCPIWLGGFAFVKRHHPAPARLFAILSLLMALLCVIGAIIVAIVMGVHGRGDYRDDYRYTYRPSYYYYRV